MKFVHSAALLIASASIVGWLTPALAAPSGPAPRTEMPRPSTQNSSPNEKARETDFEKAEYLIKAEKCDEAIPILKAVVADNGRDADALNYLGFCHRKLGKYPEALGYYQKALSVNSKHKGANEYLGELYLLMKNLPKAEEQLAVLKGLCPAGCEELEDFEADIADYKAKPPIP